MAKSDGSPLKRLLLGLGGVFAVAGLGVLWFFHSAPPKAARDEFSNRYSCPADRIDVAESSGVDPQGFVPSQKPPPEVAADPARLAVWKANQPKPYDDATYFEVKGCGHHALYGCRVPHKSSGMPHADCPYRREIDDAAKP